MDENFEVALNEEGQIPEPSSEPTNPATHAEEPKEPATPAEPEETLYELPDGRKVDGETLAKEWKENFLPDYTRKSQELSKMKAPKDINNPADENPYANPDYIPKSYDELIQEAERRALLVFEKKQEEEQARQQAIEAEVENQLSEIKKIDPNVNENDLFLHANKFGFRDLKTAYQNMKYVNDTIKTVQQNTIKNIQKRSDPVSNTGGQPNGNTPNPSAFSTARDFLRSINKN